MRKYKGKNLINTLLNIENVFGDYEGHVLPIVITFAIGSIPLFIWLFFLRGTFIPFWVIAVIDLLFTGRVALIIVGKEKEKTAFYLNQRNDVYSTANEIVHVKFIRDDGLVEYDSGLVCYYVKCYLEDYISDDAMSVALEQFMDELDYMGFYWDMYAHMAIDDVECKEWLPNLKRYNDKDVIRERMDFYNYQDEWTSTHTSLYSITFMVYSASYKLSYLSSGLKELITSDIANLFTRINILNKNEVIELMGRDICGYVDINRMLMSKYEVDKPKDFNVMWYDDNVPKKYLKNKEFDDTLEDRRPK